MIKPSYLFAIIFILCALWFSCFYPIRTEGFATQSTPNYNYGKFLYDGTDYTRPYMTPALSQHPFITSNASLFVTPNAALIKRDSKKYYLIKTGTGTSTIPPLYISSISNPSLTSTPQSYLINNTVNLQQSNTINNPIYVPITTRNTVVYNPIYTCHKNNAVIAKKLVMNGQDQYIFRINQKYYGVAYKNKNLSFIEIFNPVDIQKLPGNTLYGDIQSRSI
jgi:hypothetical protein